jgi:formyl-CoA transferase
MEHEDEFSSGRTASMASLDGLKILELGQLIAGPFAGRTLAEFGVDVIKIEPPARDGQHGGDPLRRWRLLQDGSSLWWELQSRNKRSVAVDLRGARGQEIVRQLAMDADVLIENFRPGTMEGWGLGPDVLLEQLGQDTDEVRRGIGLSADRIQALKDRFVVGGVAL